MRLYKVISVSNIHKVISYLKFNNIKSQLLVILLLMSIAELNIVMQSLNLLINKKNYSYYLFGAG